VIFRPSRDQLSTVPSPNHGVAFWAGLQIGRVSGYLAAWSRPARASIVIAGMALVIPLFWINLPGRAVAVGFVALTIFWLSVSPERLVPPLP
jgi:hypothetical protein